MNSLWSVVFKVGGVAVIALLAYLWGGEVNETKWLRKIATSPIESIDTNKLAPYLELQPVQKMEGKAIQSEHEKLDLDTMQDRHLTTELHCCKMADSLEAEYGNLVVPVTTILTDSFGGKHEIRYEPKESKFTENFTPMKFIQPIEITKIREVPVYDEPKMFVGITTEWHLDVGAGFIVGFRPLYFGMSWFPDSKPLYRIGALWEF